LFAIWRLTCFFPTQKSEELSDHPTYSFVKEALVQH